MPNKNSYRGIFTIPSTPFRENGEIEKVAVPDGPMSRTAHSLSFEDERPLLCPRRVGGYLFMPTSTPVRNADGVS